MQVLTRRINRRSVPALLLKLTDFKNRLALRASKKDVEAHKIPSADKKENITVVSSAMLKKGDIVIVKAGEQIPGDGEVIGGAASVDESAITGESAPVIREAGGDRSAVTGGTTVLSDWIVVRITSEAGESFLDKMIAMVEGASRKKTPNEIALQIFLLRFPSSLFLLRYRCIPIRYSRQNRPELIIPPLLQPWLLCLSALPLPPSAHCFPLSVSQV